MSPDLDIAQSAGARLGEGPTWDATGQRLLWVDILNCEVHHLDPATGTDVVLRTPQHVGAAKPRAGGGLVVNLRDGVGLYPPAPDGALTWLARWPREGCRGNDAAVDAQGRLWAGTMRCDEAAGGGRLHRVGADGHVDDVLDDVAVSNGTPGHRARARRTGGRARRGPPRPPRRPHGRAVRHRHRMTGGDRPQSRTPTPSSS